MKDIIIKNVEEKKWLNAKRASAKDKLIWACDNLSFTREELALIIWILSDVGMEDVLKEIGGSQ